MNRNRYHVEPSPDRFSGPYYVCRKESALQSDNDYKIEGWHYLSNAINAADYLGNAYPNDRFYVVKIEDES